MSPVTDLAGTVVIVTGSTSGIGRSVAERFAARGAGVVVNSARSQEAGVELAAALPDALYVQGDIGDERTGTAMVDAALDRWGRVDGLVNNAAVTCDVPLSDLAGLAGEHWDRVLRTNVTGTFLVSQAALPALQRSEGWIINLTSIAGIRPTGSSLPYAVSKAATDHMTALLARHVGARVRVNAVAPGLVATPWTESWGALHEIVASTAPMQRVAAPDDVADACEALVAARYVTGQVLLVDGGLSLTL